VSHQPEGRSPSLQFFRASLKRAGPTFEVSELTLHTVGVMRGPNSLPPELDFHQAHSTLRRRFDRNENPSVSRGCIESIGCGGGIRPSTLWVMRPREPHSTVGRSEVIDVRFAGKHLDSRRLSLGVQLGHPRSTGIH
jgi:hypothetical protein